MADFTAKKAKVMDSRARIRHSIQLEVEAESEGRLQRVKSQLQHVRSVLHINSRTPMGNLLMMEKLLQAFLDSEQRGMASQTPLFSFPSQIPCDKSDNTTKSCDVGIQTDILPPYVLASGENTTGCFDIHTPSKPMEDYFVASHDTLQHLVATLARYDGNCPLCGFTLDMQSFTVKQHGHAARISISCVAGHHVRWYSSSTVAGKFTANLRMVHGFTCSGLTETQYINSCKASRIGYVEQKYISTVHSSLGYKNAVKTVYERQLLEARTEAQQDPQYLLRGDVIITDARHDSSRAAQHTTVSALSNSNKKVIYSLNWSKEDLSAAASREVPMTKQVVDSLVNLGHQVGELAHDYVPALKQWASSQGIKNSYDSWHGGKGVKKAIKKVASGLVRDSEKTWFAELSDKVKCTKTHIYYAMKNCNEDATTLRNYITDIVDHYKGNHNNCHKDSRCQEDGYVCSKKPLVSERAIVAYRKAIEGTTIYKNAEDYALNWVFITSFLYKSAPGQLKYHFEYPLSYSTQNVILYFDNQWPGVYPQPGMECIDRENGVYRGNNQIINLTTSYIWSGCHEKEVQTATFLICNGDRRFRSDRDRWWYIALSNCNSPKGLVMKYRLEMTNEKDAPDQSRRVPFTKHAKHIERMLSYIWFTIS